MLVLFDCLTCDKCIPVCPNDANFTFVIPPQDVAILKATPEVDGFSVRQEGTLAITKKHQIGNFADFCNECGNCDVFCPEDGGPYVLKPRFFGSREQWAQLSTHDGFHVEQAGERTQVHARFDGVEYRAVFAGEQAEYAGPGFELRCVAADPAAGVSGHAAGEVDLTYLALMRLIARAVLETPAVTYVNA